MRRTIRAGETHGVAGQAGAQASRHARRHLAAPGRARRQDRPRLHGFGPVADRGGDILLGEPLVAAGGRGINACPGGADPADRVGSVAAELGTRSGAQSHDVAADGGGQARRGSQQLPGVPVTGRLDEHADGVTAALGRRQLDDQPGAAGDLRGAGGRQRPSILQYRDGPVGSLGKAAGQDLASPVDLQGPDRSDGGGAGRGAPRPGPQLGCVDGPYARAVYPGPDGRILDLAGIDQPLGARQQRREIQLGVQPLVVVLEEQRQPFPGEAQPGEPRRRTAVPATRRAAGAPGRCRHPRSSAPPGSGRRVPDVPPRRPAPAPSPGCRSRRTRGRSRGSRRRRRRRWPPGTPCPRRAVPGSAH